MNNTSANHTRATSPDRPDVRTFPPQKTLENPAVGMGILPPLGIIEIAYNKLVSILPALGAIFLGAICIFITIDVTGRILFNKPWDGITDLEPLFMTTVGFCSMAFCVIGRGSIRIDLLFEKMSGKTQRILYLFSTLLCVAATGLIGCQAVKASMDWNVTTFVLFVPEWPFLLTTGISISLVSLGFLFQSLHAIRYMAAHKEYLGIIIAVLLAVALALFPVAYKTLGITMSTVAVGSMVFLVLFTLMLLGVPLGLAMAIMGIIGLLLFARWPQAAFSAIATIPFTKTANFMLVALPMFLLMGDMVSISGLSDSLFDVAKKWMGRLPGGLAVATVGGCAGFGAMCGDSLATALAMTSVAMPAMKANNYNYGLAAGSLAAGGTLGILIPPSMGFIIYSMITEVSVGKLFVAGIIPGIVLTLIFMAIIVIRVKRNPELAPLSDSYPLPVKLKALTGLIPVITLFFVVVYGILDGFFTPAEGGAIGAVLGFFYALVRRKFTAKLFRRTMYDAAAMFGKMFMLFLGLYIFGAFLGASRLPNVIAQVVADLQVNRYIILSVIIVFYIILGCVMNIMPMMMLTLPSIYPTVEMLGFDGIWFGVLVVILMEMGMITPPVGMNVLTIASLMPETSASEIFRGALPFVLGMLICVGLVILFPQLALFLVE